MDNMKAQYIEPKSGPESNVVLGFAELRESIMVLDDELSIMYGRLEPVLGPPQPTDHQEGDSDGRAMSPVAQQLNEATERILTAAKGVREFRTRLDV